jgi:hypothetical protein
MTDLENYNWGKPHTARKWHIFEDGRSLCGNWMLVNNDEDVEEGDEIGEKDCKKCGRKAGLIE